MNEVGGMIGYIFGSESTDVEVSALVMAEWTLEAVVLTATVLVLLALVWVAVLSASVSYKVNKFKLSNWSALVRSTSVSSQ